MLCVQHVVVVVVLETSLLLGVCPWASVSNLSCPPRLVPAVHGCEAVYSGFEFVLYSVTSFSIRAHAHRYPPPFLLFGLPDIFVRFLSYVNRK